MNLSPLLISLKVASITTIITFFMGIFCAKLISDIKNKYIKLILDSILTLPLVLPPTVTGFFLLLIFGINGPIGKLFLEIFGIKIVFSWIASVIASTVISFPLMYNSAKAAFEQIDENLSFAGQTLGLNNWNIFWKILFPNALPGILSGGVLSFARAIGEFGATAMIAGNILGKTRTMPLAVYSAVAGGNMKEAYLYVLIILFISFIVIMAMNYFTKQKERWNN
ncbi:molybdate ABC transporter permease subunit [Fusobacterium sp. PH5-44]|uniref:molybdate ABC transporter permease subunit n=1 Tax=unclassified Fusobacterium TaxID=2648384 RepID=UPI003D21B28A